MYKIAIVLFGIILFATSCFYSKKYSYDYKYTQPATINDIDIHKRNSLEWWYFASHLSDSANVDYGVMLTLFKRNFFVNNTSYMLNCIITKNTDTIAQKWVSFYPNKKKYFSNIDNIIELNNKKLTLLITKVKGDSIKVVLQSKDKKLPNLSLVHYTKKPIVLQTPTGYMQYGNTGNAGYLSYTNNTTAGVIGFANSNINVKGKTWIDKQWNCMSIVSPTTSWIWLGIQFNNNEECMLFNFYNKNENVIQGTYIDSMGKALYFTIDKENWEELNYATTKSNRKYPTKIIFTVPTLHKKFVIESPTYDHEIDTKFLGVSKMTYWESKCKALQITKNDTLKGAAFLEITNIKNRN